mgnify:CR=1 FL=1
MHTQVDVVYDKGRGSNEPIQMMLSIKDEGILK